MEINRYYEVDFRDYVEELIESGRLDKTQAGIAKFFLSNGYEALSVKQKKVFDRMIVDNSVERCELCCCQIPWSEMLEALDNGGYCSHCAYVKEKMERE